MGPMASYGPFGERLQVEAQSARVPAAKFEVRKRRPWAFWGPEFMERGLYVFRKGT